MVFILVKRKLKIKKKLLLDTKVQELFPRHGTPFDRDKLQVSYIKLKEKII